MREDVDLEAAVRAGILGEDQALALRNLEARRSGITVASAERVEVASGVADIMTAVGIAAALLVAITIVAQVPPLVIFLLPALVWMGRRFTVERKQAASAFVIFFYYATALSGGAMALAVLAGMTAGVPNGQALDLPPGTIIVPILVTFGCWAWWRMTRLPVAVAAAWISGLNFFTQCLRAFAPNISTGAIAWITLLWGLALFIAAMSWDLSDVRRETIRARVAFWLHAAAGFLLARSAMAILTGRGDDLKGWQALYVSQPGAFDQISALAFLVLFAFGAVVALLIDRRSLIFSALYHAVLATGLLIGSREFAIGIVGVAVVVLATQWQAWRTSLVRRLPLLLAAQLPRVELENEGRRPTRRHEELLPRRAFGRRAA